MSAMDTSGGGGGDQSKRQGLISVNDLTYTLEPDLSVAVNKTRKTHFFQQDSYEAGSRGICIVNSGADYIDTRRSFLSFSASQKASYDDVDELNQGANAYFGSSGSACNLIESVTISTRSGDELCRIEEFGMFSNMLIPLKYGKEWLQSHGQSMGYNGGILSSAPTTGDTPADQDTDHVQPLKTPQFVIPLYILSPLFGYGRLMPSMLMSGLRIEIKWATARKAFMLCDAAGISDIKHVSHDSVNNSEVPNNDEEIISRRTIKDHSFTITKPVLSLCSVQLSDAIQRALNEQSAVNGLEIVYPDFDYQKAPVNPDSVLVGGESNVEIRKSCSRALKAFARCAVEGSKDDFVDSFKAEPEFPFTKYQWRLGSLYFPQQAVQGSQHAVLAEAYADVLESCDKFHKESQVIALRGDGGTSDDHYYYRDMSNESRFTSYGKTGQGFHFMTGAFRDGMQVPGSMHLSRPLLGIQQNHQYVTTNFGRIGSFANDQHVLAVNLERSSMFNLSGIPINNSRVLALQTTVAAKTSTVWTPNVIQKGGVVTASDVVKRKMHLYLKYVKLARVWLNNVEVEQ